MAFRRRNLPSVVRAPRRETAWFSSKDSTGFTSLAAGTAILDASLNATALATRPFTIVRIRGLLWWDSDQTAVTEVPFGALGMAVVSDQASAIGVTAVPTPISDEGSDLFMLWQPFVSATKFSTDIGYQNPSGNVFHFDSKAMRKVNDDQDFVIVLENASGSHGGSYVVKFRFLIKLH